MKVMAARFLQRRANRAKPLRCCGPSLRIQYRPELKENARINLQLLRADET